MQEREEVRDSIEAWKAIDEILENGGNHEPKWRKMTCPECQCIYNLQIHGFCPNCGARP